ncbi:polysaccharide deacetylase [Candidatus Vecturithrix granuli]|uniref:Polysaccharide deacetylase n=1 Tax=Vecturithrix granuli TaxID=1499967 RepID=A0A081BU93_VECG1|nr:polysaccharide deacetylase [Candidatus Vecturithrix granuli]
MWRQRVKIVCTLLVYMLVHPFCSAFAESWYDYYEQAQHAFQNKEWKTAITLYQRAIAADPEPDSRKKYGGRTVAYYPYFELGLAYLATGNFEAAYQSCQQAKERGVAPQDLVEGKCLKIIANVFEKLQRPLPPSPSLPQQQQAPHIQILSEVPPLTDQIAVIIEGMASSELGIKEIQLSVENLGVTGTTTFVMPGRKEESFNIHVPLEPGRSVITLSAFDGQSNATAQKFVVVRQTTAVAGAPATVQPIQPTPTPIPAHIPQDTRPIITLLSDVPATTNEVKLLIKGIVIDDQGVKDIQVTVHQPGKKGLAIELPAQKIQDTFQTEISLEPGQNEILIEAMDTSGQTTTLTLMVLRTSTFAPDAPLAQQPSEVPAISQQRPGDVYAVIIGIGDYQDDRIPDLQFTVNDAQGLYNVLIDPEFGGVPKDHIKLLLNEEATDRAIKGAIGGWLSRQAKKEDTVIIYYSGHGAPEMRDTYWVTYNANIDDLYTTALNNNEITEMLARIESERVITFLDSCYSAATVKRKDRTRSIQTEIPWENFAGKGRVTISASDGKQLSLELNEYGHGVFTYYLLEGLKGKADKNQDAIVDVDEIWNYVKFQVTDTARKAGNPQTPVLQGSITAGIPLTFNMTLLREQQHQYQATKKQEQLKQFLMTGAITLVQYNCAYKILKTGESNIWVEGLLSGQLDPEVFRESFECH